MKKRLLALMLVAAMLMGMSMTTFAAEEKSNGGEITIYKDYTLVGSTDENLYPAEDLAFVSEPSSANPDSTNLSVAGIKVAQTKDNAIKITVPEYTKVGVYEYTITETTPNPATQGVTTYSSESISISVLVEYDYEDEDKDGNLLKATYGVTQINGEKADTFTNEYSVGSLSIDKTVSGNLANANKEFTITISFTSDEEVKSDIDNGPKATDWVKEGNVWKATTVIKTTGNDDAVTLNNIPYDVTYTVEEAAEHLVGEKNGEEGYTVSYKLNNQDVTSVSGVIDSASDSVIVNNHKEDSIATGLIINNFPYILALAAVALVAVAFMRKRRSF